MARKKKKIQETTIENYYDLRIDKIDELVDALKDDESDKQDEIVNYDMNTNMGVDDPKNVKFNGRQKQFDPYKTDFLGRVPKWLKAIFIKFWFAGAGCYFIMWGIGIRDEDAVLLMGIVLGLFTDIFVNPLFRFMETKPKEYNDYMMFPFPFRQFWTFFTNILYYIVVLFFVNLCYLGVNELVNLINATQSQYYLGVEPLMFGVFAVIVDMAFIGIKDGIVALVRRLKKKKKEGMANA